MNLSFLCELYSLYHLCEFLSTFFNNFVELFYTTCYYDYTILVKEGVLLMLALYKNIKSRRTELKMSQDTLAELTGYKDRSSIAKIEKGDVDLAESKIREFAKALKVSPQELMGWDKDESTDPDSEFSPEVRAAARGMMELSKDKRKTAIEMIDFLSEQGRNAKK